MSKIGDKVYFWLQLSSSEEFPEESFGMNILGEIVGFGENCFIVETSLPCYQEPWFECIGFEVVVKEKKSKTSFDRKRILNVS